jgi:hypothetical protein
MGYRDLMMCGSIPETLPETPINITLSQTLDNPNAYNTSDGDSFGYSIAISDSYAIVGAYGEDDAGGLTSGKAYIFNPATGALLSTLDNPNAYGTTAVDVFGYSVGISESYAIVGAYNEKSPAGDVGSGVVYIYNPSTGALLWTLDNPNAYDTSLNDNFGQNVAISNTYAIVGSHQEDDAGGLSSGKAYIYNPSTGALLWTLDNPNAYSTTASDQFGIDISISDNYAIVGAYGEDDAGGLSSGKAYIFDNATGTLLHTLDNPNAYDTSAGDSFGYSVAISDNYAIVGAYGEDDAGGLSSGKAYIFNPATGALLSTLDNPNAYNTSLNDYFGRSVFISDNYAIVGAYLEDDAGGLSSGKAYIYRIPTIISAPSNILNNPNPYGTSTEDRFGYSVDISDNYSIVSAYQEDDAGGVQSGKAYIYDNTTGALLHTLNNPNAYGTSTEDYFGYCVAISDTYAIIGAHYESTQSGKAYIYNSVTGALLHTLNAYSTGGFFGRSVSISNSYAIVGAYGVDDTQADSGRAYIFNTTNGSLLHTLYNPNPYGTSAADRFGYSVSTHGNYSIVGAYQEDDAGGLSSGKAYIFDNVTGALLHTLDNPNAYGTSAGDSFGRAVAISNTYSIVGAYLEDDAGGLSSGKAYIYDNATGALLWTLDNPNAYSTTANDWFGYSVAISDSYAIVGAYLEDDAGGLSSGKAYIYDNATGILLHTLDNPNAFGTSTGDQFGYTVSISDTHVIIGAPLEDEDGYLNSGKAYIYDL